MLDVGGQTRDWDDRATVREETLDAGDVVEPPRGQPWFWLPVPWEAQQLAPQVLRAEKPWPRSAWEREEVQSLLCRIPQARGTLKTPSGRSAVRVFPRERRAG